MNTESATLVSIRLSAWSGRKRDGRASADLTSTKNADSDSASVWKMLVSKQWLDPVNKIDNLIRNEFYRLTLAYPATSIGLLPETSRERFEQSMRLLFDERRQAVDHAMTLYRDERAKARHRLGDMFSETDYPPTECIAGKYAAGFTYLPMPAGWKGGIDDADLQARLDTARHEGFAEAYRDAWGRIADCAGNVANKLKAFNPDGKGKARGAFRDSLIDNARELIETLESMIGVFGDDELSATLDTIKRDLAAYAPDVLRGDERKRLQVMSVAQSILDKALGKIEAGLPVATMPAAPQAAPVPAAPAPVLAPCDDDWSDLYK